MWEYFIYFAVASVLLWTGGAIEAWRGKRIFAMWLTTAGLMVFFGFILGLWITMEHPPLRTMGETRLWYSFFLPVAGMIVYSRWHYKWIFSFSTLLALVFICINVFKPEIHSKTLMPALQSPWFAPHVIVYMFAYAMLGAATIMAIVLLVQQHKLYRERIADDGQQSLVKAVEVTDNLVYVGWGFLTIGMLFGALWAKEVWGHYWSWDPKETWAAITWLSYLVYVHYRIAWSKQVKTAMVILLISFCMLQICWWGINYLPSAKDSSVHTYSSK